MECFVPLWVIQESTGRRVRRLDELVYCFKQRTAYERRIRDWSSDVCSSDLLGEAARTADDAARYYASYAAAIGAPPAAGHAVVHQLVGEIGSASCRGRVCTYV